MHDSRPLPLIGKSPAMLEVRQLIAQLAPSVSTVLITGESGTGKELIAQALHHQSPRQSGQFVPINCGAIPRELLESELFGHRKGSFTGALADRMGRFEMAHGGTLFLDEIGDLPADMQVKLLRVLQERRIEPLGSTKSLPVDVRVVAATHKNLEQEVAQGRFREDLYYRLNVLPVRTTPLRERPEDIPELLSHYARKHTSSGQLPLTFSNDCIQALSQYHWPGNIRELSNLVDRFSAMYPGQHLEMSWIPDWLLPSGLADIKGKMMLATAEAPSLQTITQLFVDGPDASPGHASAHSAETAMTCDVEDVIFRAQGIVPLGPEGISLKDQMVSIERGYIEQALERTQWNVSHTARLLNLQRTTLIEKINKYGLKKA